VVHAGWELQDLPWGIAAVEAYAERNPYCPEERALHLMGRAYGLLVICG